MATARSEEELCAIIQDRVLKLETKANHFPIYNGIVMVEDKLLVIDDDAWDLQMYNRHDGKLISTSYILASRPMGVCMIGKTEVGVCLLDGILVILSLTLLDDEKLAKTLSLRTKFCECHSVANLNSEKLLVSGRKYTDEDVLCWGIVDIKDGRFDSIYDICKGGIGRIHTAIKGNTVYISCMNSYSKNNGVYAYDIFSPHIPIFLYQHRELKQPWSIMADKDYVYVSELDSNIIHQLNDGGKLVQTHQVTLPLTEIFYDDQYGVLYTTSYGSNDITEYKIEFLQEAGIPIEIMAIDDRSIKVYEEALKAGKERVHNIRIMVVGRMNVGKSTLVKRLLGQKVNISERCRTEGIDVSLNCCQVSLSTHEWTNRPKDSKQDYILQRLIKVWEETSQREGKAHDLELDAISNQKGERTDGNILRHATDDNNTDVLYRQSQQNVVQNLSSTPNVQIKSSTVEQSSLIRLETSTTPGSEPAKNVNSENMKTDPIMDMLKLLRQNPHRAEQDANKQAYVTVMDYAGEYAFYTTHQMFLSRRAIYLFVADCSRGVNDLVEDTIYKEIDLVDICMNSIHSCAPPDKDILNSANSRTSYKVIPPPVILVGTHIDQIPKFLKMRRHQQGKRYLQEIRSYLKDKPTVVHLVDEDFAIDNTVVDSELEKLKRKIVEVASQQPYWGEQVPTRWFLLEHQLMRLKEAGVKVMPRIAVEALNKEGTVQIKDEELDLCLTYLHETGTIMYFDIEVLRDNIVLDPTWLIDALKCLINARGDNDNTQEMFDLKKKGILDPKLVETIWSEELKAHKSHALMIMEKLNIIAKFRSFDVMGTKEEDYFLVPCMLRQEVPKEVTSPEQDASVVTTPEMRCIFTGKYLPIPIFHRLLAACVAHWPVARNDKSEPLIFCGCCVFNLDLFHRLTVYIKSHIVYAKLTRTKSMPLDARLCSHVRRFITQNLTKITFYLGQNLRYELEAPDYPWREGFDSDATITPEDMNQQRLVVALLKVGGKAMREILCACLPPNTDLRSVILANKIKLTIGPGKLNHDQMKLVFPDPLMMTVGKVDDFDVSLLYKLIRNISTVNPHSSGWGKEPQNNPRDKSLGASVERIRIYRNNIAYSRDGKVSNQDFYDYWCKFEALIDDIEQVLGNQGYRAILNKLKSQVTSFHESN